MTNIFKKTLNTLLKDYDDGAKFTDYIRQNVKVLPLFNFSIFATQLHREDNFNYKNLNIGNYFYIEINTTGFNDADEEAIYTYLKQLYCSYSVKADNNTKMDTNRIEYKLPYMNRCSTVNEHIDYLDIYKITEANLESCAKADLTQSIVNKILKIMCKYYKHKIDLTLNESIFYKSDAKSIEYPYIIARSTCQIAQMVDDKKPLIVRQEIRPIPIEYEVVALSEYVFRQYMDRLAKYLYEHDLFLINHMGLLQQQIDTNYKNRKIASDYSLDPYLRAKEQAQESDRIPEERA